MRSAGPYTRAYFRPTAPSLIVFPAATAGNGLKQFMPPIPFASIGHSAPHDSSGDRQGAAIRRPAVNARTGEQQEVFIGDCRGRRLER